MIEVRDICARPLARVTQLCEGTRLRTSRGIKLTSVEEGVCAPGFPSVTVRLIADGPIVFRGMYQGEVRAEVTNE